MLAESQRYSGVEIGQRGSGDGGDRLRGGKGPDESVDVVEVEWRFRKGEGEDRAVILLV